MIKLTELTSGVRIVSEKMDTVKTVAMGIFVKAGSIDERPEEFGISHFIEHMMFKGTYRRTAKEIAESFDRLGGSVNAYTTRDHTCYYFKTTSDTFEVAGDIIFDMISGSIFNEEELNKERQVILEEIKMMEDQPDDLAMEHCSRLVFKGDPLEHDIAGTEISLSGQTRDSLKEYISREYALNNIVVSVAGDFDLNKVINMVEKGLQGFISSKKKEEKELSPYKPGQIKINKKIEQTNLCLGRRFVTLDSDDYFAAVFYNNILGGTMSSRLFQKIREEKGLAYTVMSLPQITVRAGLILIYAGVAHEKSQECLEAIFGELDLLRKEGISADELDKARNQGKSSIVFSMERTHSRMMSIGRNMLLMNQIIEQDRLVDLIEKVKIDDVNKIGEMVGDREGFSLALVAPES